MRYLLLSSALVIAGCGGPYRHLQRSNADAACLEKFRPSFKSVLYNTQVNVINKHLSGLLLIKTMPDSTIRMVFTSETGITFFDFGFARTGEFTVHNIIRQMNKKPVIKTLRKDFELMLMQDLEKSPAEILEKGGLHYFAYRNGKEMDYYITTKDCARLIRLEKASKRKTKLQVVMQDYKSGVPDTIGLSHKNLRFNIGLKRLQR